MSPHKTLNNAILAQALSHPLRAKMLFVMQEGEASPKELAAQFGVPLANVAYHIQVLRKLKLIRLVRKTPRRGAIEHHYRVHGVVDIEAAVWGEAPALIKERAVSEWLKDVGEYVTRAAAAGGFNRANAALTRSRLVFDEEGWVLIAGKLEEIHALADEVSRASEERLKHADHAGEVRAGMVLMLFESMPQVPDADEAHDGGPQSESKPAKRGPRISR